jgi:hypothetical protein
MPFGELSAVYYKHVQTARRKLTVNWLILMMRAARQEVEAKAQDAVQRQIELEAQIVERERARADRERLIAALETDSLQALQAVASLFYMMRPLADSAAADAQAARDFGLGEGAFAEKATAFHPPFFNLFRS